MTKYNKQNKQSNKHTTQKINKNKHNRTINRKINVTNTIIKIIIANNNKQNLTKMTNKQT